MKKILILTILTLLILTACSRTIKPDKVVKIEFDLEEAEEIMKLTWKTVNEMNTSEYETKVIIPVSSRKEFFDTYDFSYMSENIKSNIYETLVEIEFDESKIEEDEISQDSINEIKDEKGNLVFEDKKIQTYIPTIYDKGVFIKEAYIEETIYKEEDSHYNSIKLSIIEASNENIIGKLQDYSRKNIFEKDDEGNWILKEIVGTFSVSWPRDE